MLLYFFFIFKYSFNNIKKRKKQVTFGYFLDIVFEFLSLGFILKNPCFFLNLQNRLVGYQNFILLASGNGKLIFL